MDKLANRLVLMLVAAATLSALTATLVVHVTAPSPIDRAVAAYLAAHPASVQEVSK